MPMRQAEGATFKVSVDPIGHPDFFRKVSLFEPGVRHAQEGGIVEPNESDNETLWDARDVARYFRASRSWVYHQAEAGLIPCVRICGLLRFKPEVIRAFAAGEAPSGGRVVASVSKNGR